MSCARLLALFTLAALTPSTAMADTIDPDFDTLESTSPNATVTPDQLELTSTVDATSVNTGSANELATTYRGEVSFASRDANGPYWLEWSKDDHVTPGGADHYFGDGGVDECLAVEDFQALIDAVGTGIGDVYDTDHGVRFRIGPFPSGAEPITAGANGASLLPDEWSAAHRMSRLSFLTTGTHADDRCRSWGTPMAASIT